MTHIHLSATLTKTPELERGSCKLKVSYLNDSGTKCYITAVAKGKLAKELSTLLKGDTVWIDGRLSGFKSDRWKTYVIIEQACIVRKRREDQ